MEKVPEQPLDDEAMEVAGPERDFALGSLDFEGLSPTDFEEFCFDFMAESGFSNVDWRKGDSARRIAVRSWSRYRRAPVHEGH